MISGHFFITGFMGSGKSTIGKKLAGQLNMPFIDSDNEIEQKYGKAIKDIFRDEGEPYFRKIEEEEIDRVCRREERSVIALGGGALMSEKSLKTVLENGLLIYIESSPEAIWKRTHHSTRRPLMPKSSKPEDHRQRIKSLMKEREKGYMAAQIKLNRDEIEAETAVRRLVKKIEEYLKRNNGKD